MTIIKVRLESVDDALGVLEKVLKGSVWLQERITDVHRRETLIARLIDDTAPPLAKFAHNFTVETSQTGIVSGGLPSNNELIARLAALDTVSKSVESTAKLLADKSLDEGRHALAAGDTNTTIIKAADHAYCMAIADVSGGIVDVAKEVIFDTPVRPDATGRLIKAVDQHLKITFG